MMNYDSRSPLYMQVQQYIQRRIEHGELQAHDRIPTEKELMAQFEVSRITVVNALASLVKEGYIYRVPGRGSFVAEATPRIESSHSMHEPAGKSDSIYKHSAVTQSRLVGLVMPSLNDLFAMRLLTAIRETLQARGLTLMVAFSDGNKVEEERLIRQFVQLGAEGLLIFPVDKDTYNEEILTLKVNQFPFVLIDRYLPGVETDYVCSDNRLGAQMAVEHLFTLGHQRIVICTDAYRECVSVKDRIAGYMNAYEGNGHMIDPALIFTDFPMPSEHEAIESNLLAECMRNRAATAYVALSGRIGIQLLHLAKRLQLRVPEDISIVTFDNPESSTEHETFFDHIYQNEDEMGRRAASILIRRLDKGHASAEEPYTELANKYEKVILAPQLIIKRSSGPLQAFAKFPS
ncbi:GntR family transcriptional regulator [Paenibacillus assamensis]|uniref:GntR family transcriptional regulator n=1 Tax=Paenibacillus assamensis TaxID=311244 RepID=UPI001FDF4A9B|nr:GntR family transcriptional regulator [Paenibacillus assamensis]